MITALFWFQIIMGFAYSVPLILNLWKGETEGLTLATFAIFMVYTVLGLSLSLSAYREIQSKIRRQTLMIFVIWMLLIGIVFGLGCFTIPWSDADSIFTAAIFILTLSTVWKYHGISDPMGRGWIAVWCKAMPQLWLGATMLIFTHDFKGLDGISLIAGHLTSTPRLVQIVWSGKQGGWDHPTRGLLLGETSNVVTWWVVTLVWLYLFSLESPLLRALFSFPQKKLTVRFLYGILKL